MRFALIGYRIATASGPKRVTGWAIHLPAPFAGLRFCVRRATPRAWCIDHYDSGMAVTGPQLLVCSLHTYTDRELALANRLACDRTSRAACAAWLVRWLKHTHRGGRLRETLVQNGYGWCADEARL